MIPKNGLNFSWTRFRTSRKDVPYAGMDYTIILDQTQQYVRSFFSSHVDEKIIYHDHTHTEQVVKAVRMIATVALRWSLRRMAETAHAMEKALIVSVMVITDGR